VQLALLMIFFQQEPAIERLVYVVIFTENPNMAKVEVENIQTLTELQISQ
jgi:hypothetical protein